MNSKSALVNSKIANEVRVLGDRHNGKLELRQGTTTPSARVYIARTSLSIQMQMRLLQQPKYFHSRE